MYCRNAIRLLHGQLSATLSLHKGLVKIAQLENISKEARIYLDTHIAHEKYIEIGN